MLRTCGSLQCRLGDGGVVQRHSTGVRLWGAGGGRGGDWIWYHTRFSLPINTQIITISAFKETTNAFKCNMALHEMIASHPARVYSESLNADARFKKRATLLPGLGPRFFGIFTESAGAWACCRAILCAQLAGSLPLVRPTPVTGRPGPLMTASSQPDLFAQASCTHRAEDT